MKKRRAVHPLVDVQLGHIGVPVEVHDADIAIDIRRQSANVRIADGVIATENDRKGRVLMQIGNALVDLVEGFFDIGRE